MDPKKNILLEWIVRMFKLITVEPFLLCYVLPNSISALAIQNLNMEKACIVELNFTRGICESVLDGVYDNDTLPALNGAQKLVADMTAWVEPIQSGIPAILILFIGEWSDKTGHRKILMLIPMIGEFISAAGLMLTTYYFREWPLWVTGLVESLPTALTGGRSIALMAAYSYIADVTSLESRTFRIGIIAVIVTLGVPIGTAISGVLTRKGGYYGVFGTGLILYTLGILYTIFGIKDVKRTKMEGNFCRKVADFLNPLNVISTLKLPFTGPKQQIMQVLLVIWAHIVIIGPIFGEGAVFFLYMLGRYHMDIEDISFFLTYSVCLGIVGTAIAITIFSKWLKMHDALLGIIATASKVLSSTVYGLAPNRDWFYSGPVFDIFGNSGVTAIRSLGTKVVEPEQVGKMCSLIGFVEAVVPVIYTPLYSKVYAHTLEDFPGAFYLLGGAMTVPAFFIFIILYIVHKKRERDIVKHPEKKENYAHENAVTSL